MPDAPGERPAGTLHLSARHRAMLEALLKEHLPEVEVWAYGSRVNGESHDGSDLDLVLRGPGLAKIDISRLADFEEALRDSTVPFLVEAHDWARLPESFHREIKRNHVIITSVTGDDNGESSTSGWFYHPKFPKHWKRHPLFSLAQWVNGLAFRRIQFSPGGKPVIKIAEIKGGITQQTKFTEQTFDESVRVSNGNLLFSWSGQPDSSIDAFRWRGPDGWLNQHVFRVTPRKSIDTTFFYYLLRYLRPNFVEIARNKQTTGLGHVTKRDLASMDVAVPSPTEQREIAHILGTLDDKIELNRRMNETLEAMVRGLFKSWFVNFEPVRAKMVGSGIILPKHVADLFPDMLTGSEIGQIPDGWSVGCVGDVVSSERRGVDTIDLRVDLPYIGLEHMPRGSIAVTEWGSSEDVSSRKSAFSKGDLLFGKLRPYFRKVGLAPVSGVCSTDIVVMSPKKKIWSAFALMVVSSADFVNYADRTSTGTRMPRTSWKTMKSYSVCFPPERVAREFQNVVGPMLERIDVNIHSIRQLQDMRDMLLPKLVSGELLVTETLGRLAPVS